MRIAMLLAALALSAAGGAGALEIHLPPETATYKPSELPGYQLVQRNCMTCHAAQYASSQPPASPRAYWEATVRKMKKPFGAQFADEDVPAMVDYLVKTYGASGAPQQRSPPWPSPQPLPLFLLRLPAARMSRLCWRPMAAWHAMPSTRKWSAPALRKWPPNTGARMAPLPWQRISAAAAPANGDPCPCRRSASSAMPRLPPWQNTSSPVKSPRSPAAIYRRIPMRQPFGRRMGATPAPCHSTWSARFPLLSLTLFINE